MNSPFGRAAALCLALSVLPAIASAQQVQQAQKPIVKPIPGRPHPMPSRRPYRPGHNNSTYPVLIDGSVMNRYLATPTPAPHHTAKPAKTKNGQDVFETHSSDDAK